MRIEDILEEAITQHGGSGLAAEMGVSPSDITRFRSQTFGFTISKINKLLDVCGCTITRKDDREKLIEVLMTVTDLYREKKNSLGRSG
jgi:hypothetical protein